MNRNQGRPEPRKGHPPHMPQPKNHDPYAHKSKAAGAQVCDDCDIVHHAGRWYEGAPPVGDVGRTVCPACQRIRDRYPAGTITLPSEFLEQREEVMGMLKNAEKAERETHPLERLMAVEDGEGGTLVVTTTGLHLAKAITSKLERRFHKKARIHYPPEAHLMQADWSA